MTTSNDTPKPPDSPPLREVSPKELQNILEGHRKWVESQEKEGSRADFRGVNLQGADLAGAKLSYATFLNASLKGTNLDNADLLGADLGGAIFQQAKLGGANLERASLMWGNLQEAFLVQANLQEALLIECDLRNAILCRAKLQKAELNAAKLRDANLEDADLTGVKGLLAGQLGGTNVTGARLPEDIHKFEGLEHVTELAKIAKRLFLSMLLGCVYAWLTIATTTDARLLTNSASSPLPIIQTPVPIAGFYWAAPLILLAIYVWFHLYLQEMWKGLAGLPAILPDGKALDEKAYPWLLTGLVRPHFKLLRENRPPLSRIKVGISILLAWWVVPFTFALFWLRYLPRHDWWGTGLHVVLLTVAIVCAIRFQHLAKLTLRGEEREPIRLGKEWKSLITYTQAMKRTWRVVLCGLAIFIMSLTVSDGAINGRFGEVESFGKMNGTQPEPEVLLHRTIIPAILPYIGWRGYADLLEADVSTKPAGWHTSSEKSELLEMVNGAKLHGADLRNALAAGAFLAKANLTEARLQRAILTGADLRGATLFRAQLQGANLQLAKLQEAILVEAQLQGADLRSANLKEAKLNEAQLQRTDLRMAQLQGAFLIGANLREASLKWANLEGAKFHAGFIKGGQEFVQQQADLRQADLTNAEGLTQSQINLACMDETTKLPKGLKWRGRCLGYDSGHAKK